MFLGYCGFIFAAVGFVLVGALLWRLGILVPLFGEIPADSPYLTVPVITILGGIPVAFAIALTLILIEHRIR